MRSSGRGKLSLDNSLRIRLDVWGDRGGEMRAGQGLQQRVSSMVNGLQYCAQTHALMARAIGWFDLLLARTQIRRQVAEAARLLEAWSALNASHENAICSMGVGPARRFNALGDHALCRRLRKVVCCPDALCNFRGPLLEERQAPSPASERIHGDIPVGSSPVAVPRTLNWESPIYIHLR